jgi:protein gp37
MGDKTGIEWTDATWNPVRGCSRVSAGCFNCYAETVAHRFSKPGQPYEGLTKMVNGRPTWNGKIQLVYDHLEQPLRWWRNRKIFVNSMSDLFHEEVPTEYIDKVFAIMAMAPWHTFQVLTKRPERMLEYVKSRNCAMMHSVATMILGYDNPKRRAVNDWPLPNVWLGVSVEDQDAANLRIPLLLNTPAAVRWVSAEPLLGAINFTRLRPPNVTWLDCLEGREHDGPSTTSGGPKLDWIVCGGESGHGARPMHMDWVTEIRDQCAAADVPFLFKQWGEWEIATAENGHNFSAMPDSPKYCWVSYDGRTHKITAPMNTGHDVYAMANVGKKKAGRLLDGVEHNGYPK